MKNLFILFLFCPLLVWGQNLVQAEYFFDEDPGYGKAIKMGFAPQETISLEANLYIELIPPGFHTLHYRFKDDTNGWGHTYTSHVFFGSEEANLQKAEYFFDRDPGYGKGIQLQFEDASTIALSAHLNFDMLEPGLHTFFYRLKSKNGWGTTLSHQVYKPAIPKICKIIYRFDTAPEEHIINLGSTVHDLSHEQSIDISALDVGAHSIHMYVENTSGHKSAVWSSSFNVKLGGAVKTIANEKPRFYPNPASDIIYFSGNQAADYISIISTEGKLIQSYRNSTEINISDIANGLYLLSYQQDGKMTISTLVIAH